MNKYVIKIQKPIKFLPLIYSLLFIASCATKKPSSTAFKYQIRGRIEGSQDGDTLLLGVLGNPIRINKAIIKDSEFEFKGTAPELSIAFIQYRYTFDLTGTFILENKPILMEAQVKEDPDYATGKVVKGGKQNQYFLELNKLQEPERKLMGEATRKISQAQKEGNTAEEEFYQNRNQEAAKKLRKIREQYIKDHPDAMAALYYFYNFGDYKFNGLEKTLAILNMVDDQIKKTTLWSRIKEKAELESKK
jgi:hypothetical protein